MMKELSMSKVYQLLEPGPVVLLTTADRGRINVMAMSWHMMVKFEPPLVACIVSSADYSFVALRATRECMIAIPTLELAPIVVQAGNTSGRDLDKFEAFGLTPLPAEHVAPPMVAECYANLECKVIDTRVLLTNTIFSSLKCSRPGLILRTRHQKPSIITDMALSSSMVRRSR